MAVTQEKKYYYSEIFHSIQGEGNYTGVPTAWIRFFMCNLQCNGFGQIDPTKPDTYELPFEDFDVDSVSRVEDLPVWDKGCDSSYTWAKKFKKLMGEETPTVLAQKIINVMKNESNPEGLFLHPVTQQRQHLCITGGEPLMVTGQRATIGIYEELERQGNLPASMTFETNGTQKLLPEFVEWVNRIDIEIFFSCSPKLFTVSGEKPEKAIKPEIVKQYRELSSKGQLKFVVGHKEREWEEMEQAIAKFKDAGVDWPIWVMPTGAREEEQTTTAGAVAEKAFKRGYNVAARVHVYLFGNAIGT
jgi:6-pyruvoyltetrahydropterin 2'-reductase|tara:strand:- start:12265 stop:13170 length:906 start_codon:yes stop_codon:yes gene_type:complete